MLPRAGDAAGGLWCANGAGSQQTYQPRKGRGGARAGAGRKPTLTGRSDDYVGGECERRWKAALKRRAMERNEAKIDDRDGLRSLHRDAVSVARGSARRDRGLVELKKAVESGEVAASAAAEIAAIPDVQRREILASTLVRLGPITHDIDAEMEALGGRYQSLSLKQVKGARRRIINEVAAWALNERAGPCLLAA